MFHCCMESDLKERHYIISSYYGIGNFGNHANFDFRLLADLHVLGSGESKKHKISIVTGCSLVSVLVR